MDEVVVRGAAGDEHAEIDRAGGKGEQLLAIERRGQLAAAIAAENIGSSCVMRRSK